MSSSNVSDSLSEKHEPHILEQSQPSDSQSHHSLEKSQPSDSQSHHSLEKSQPSDSQSHHSLEKSHHNLTSESQHVNKPGACIDDFISEQRPWYKVPHLLHLNFCIFIITLTSSNNGLDGSLLNGLQSLTYWQNYFNHPTGTDLGLLSNGTIFGIIISFPFTGYLTDKFGRKFVIGFGQSIVVIGSILQGLSTNFAFFFVSRLIIGFGTGTAVVGSPSLISELSYPTHREICTFAYNVLWYLGAILAAWVTYGTRNLKSDFSWRVPSYIQGVLPLIQVLFLWMVPESPRYLVAKGKIDQAEKILKKFHVGNSNHPQDLALVEFELREIETAIATERALSGVKYTDFITKKSFRKRLFLIVFTGVIMQLSGNGLVAYYLNKVLNSIGITEERKQLQINGCLMIYNFVCAIAVCTTSRYFKRRTLFLTCVGFMLLSYVIWTVLSAINQQRHFQDTSLGNGVLAMIFFYYLAYNIGVNGLPYLYVTEILPYSHRAKGISIFQLVQEIVLVYNGFVNPIAMDAIDWKYYIVYCCILCVELFVVFFFYPETSGYTLEQVANVFGDTVNDVDLDSYMNPAKRQSLDHLERV